jgi:hypothetical protein
MSDFDPMRITGRPARGKLEAMVARFLLWAFICTISSFAAIVWATNLRPDWLAVACGIFLFVLAYTAITGTRGFLTWLRSRYVRRAFWIAYATRVGVSLIFPVGMAIDLIPGLLAMSIVGVTQRDSHFTFGATLATTLLVGVLMHVILAIYFGIVYGLARLVMRDPDAEPRGHGFQVLPRVPQSVLPVDASRH